MGKGEGKIQEETCSKYPFYSADMERMVYFRQIVLFTMYPTPCPGKINRGVPYNGYR